MRTLSDEQIRTLHFVAGCHARDVRESLRDASRARFNGDLAASMAGVSARLAWSVAVTLERVEAQL
jgi:hypothetical protein